MKRSKRGVDPCFFPALTSQSLQTPVGQLNRAVSCCFSHRCFKINSALSFKHALLFLRCLDPSHSAHITKHVTWIWESSWHVHTVWLSKMPFSRRYIYKLGSRQIIDDISREEGRWDHQVYKEIEREIKSLGMPMFSYYKNFNIFPYEFRKSHHTDILECQGWKTLKTLFGSLHLRLVTSDSGFTKPRGNGKGNCYSVVVPFSHSVEYGLGNMPRKTPYWVTTRKFTFFFSGCATMPREGARASQNR